ncbi:MAG: peptidoglycan DD-metalloendopeptidase family protein [Desulfobacteraceae bacterium]|nr:peptidoglycan DD-metalloendopeptidase family protein [Desulfobacteraceae bacterium]
MRKNFKIWFHIGSETDIKELNVPQYVAYLFFILVFFIISGIFYTGFDYYQIKSSSFNNHFLTNKISDQKNEIQSQRKQIQNFAETITDLKKQVKDLCIFENRVRLIADIGESTDSGLIGIGGIPNTDLDYNLEPDLKHNNLIREMHEQVNQTNLAVVKQTQDFEELIQELHKKKNILASTPSVKPVYGWISSRFGYRKSPFTGLNEFHSGLDIANKKGTKIIATANGKVSYTGKKLLIGNLITIDHGHGIVTKYGHLQKSLVKFGQNIKRGDVIGLMGNSGRSTGPHVHYEVRINGTPVNPGKYILN